MSNFNKVKTFMETFGQEVKTSPSFSTDKINSLRYDLIKEELEELKEAMKNRDLLEVAEVVSEGRSGSAGFNSKRKTFVGWAHWCARGVV